MWSCFRELLKIFKGRDILMKCGLVDGEGRLNKAIAMHWQTQDSEGTAISPHRAWEIW